MQFDAADILRDWQPPILITVGCAVTAALYLRGFFQLRKSRPAFSSWRAVSFVSGLTVLWLALASPLEELSDTLLTAHMVEHLLLMSAVPPLLLVGWPVVPLLRGLPAPLRHPMLDPLLRSNIVRSIWHQLDRPVLAWLAMNLTLLLWHVPAAYDFALTHEMWHDFEHICFLLTSLLFWWILLRPWPSKPGTLGWGALIYLLTADAVNTVLSAVLAFIGHPVYLYYTAHPNALGLDPSNDQVLGASVMWVFGSIAFLLPALVIANRLLFGDTAKN